MKLPKLSRRLAAPLLAAVLAASPLASVRGDQSAPVQIFSNDRLTLKIQNDGSAYRGSIVLGDKTFSVTAHGNGVHLDGTFADSDGNSYSFTADTSGNSLDFKTGKATYHLGAENALAAPAARNAGVGLKLNFADDGAITITGLLPGGPAERAGLPVGDRLVAIDGKPLHTVDDLAALMPGIAGSTVTLTLRHLQGNKDFTLTREVIQPPPGEHLAGQEPAPQPAPPAVGDAPAADNAPDPKLPWLHEGLVISGTWATYIYPGHSMDFEEDSEGHPNAHSKDGKPLDATEYHGTSAGGVAQTVITAIEGDTVTICTNSFANDSVQGFKEPVSQHSPMGETKKLAANDIWMEPAKLAAMHTDNDQQILVASVQWHIGNQVFDAIRVTHAGPDGYIDRVYDRNTGLCIHIFTSHAGAAPTGKYHVEGETPEADTIINSIDFIGFHTVHAPWANEPLPQWTRQFKALHYRGTVQMLGMPNVGQPSQVTLDITAAANSGNTWIGANASSGMIVPGISTIPQQIPTVYGHDQIGAIFAGPAALAKLREGQVLDEDPTTHMKTVVSKADGRAVRIESANTGGGSFATYDTQSGKMIEYGFVDQISKQAWTYKLVGEE